MLPIITSSANILWTKGCRFAEMEMNKDARRKQKSMAWLIRVFPVRKMLKRIESKMATESRPKKILDFEK